jgi:hypothetical protein
MNISCVYLTLFVKATLFSGSISHENDGNRFGHALSLFTTAVTGVLQLMCLNWGLKVYGSRLVMPVLRCA